jgi:hypothetical protein
MFQCRARWAGLFGKFHAAKVGRFRGVEKPWKPIRNSPLVGPEVRPNFAAHKQVPHFLTAGRRTVCAVG